MLDLDTLDLDTILDQAVAEGELAAGVHPDIVARRFPQVRVAAEILTSATAKPPRWTAAEDQFIRDNVGYYTDGEIALALGRSPSAVKIRRKRHLRLDAPSTSPEFMSGKQVAIALGIDDHTAIALADRDIIPTWRYSERETRLTRRVTFLRWAVNPLHWVYFIRSVRDTSRLGDDHLRRLIERQKQRWNDDWWTGGEVADYHGVHHTDVNRMMRAGKLSGVRWGNWWYLRSEGTKEGLIFFKGSGSAQGDDHSEEADCFILIGVALGIMQIDLAPLMKRTVKQVAYRLKILREQGIAQDLIDKYGLAIQFDPDTGELRGDWDNYGWMFPRVKPYW